MLTFVLDVLGEVLGIGNLYCTYAILFGQKRNVCETKGLLKLASKHYLSKLWMSSSVATRGADSYSTSGEWAPRQLWDSAQLVTRLLQ